MQQIKAGGLYRATFLYNPEHGGVGRELLGFDRPRPGLRRAGSAGGSASGGRSAAVVTKDNVSEYEQYAFD